MSHAKVLKIDQIQKLPGPGFKDLIQLGAGIQKRPLETYLEIHKNYGDIVWCPWPGHPTLFLYHPVLIRHVLKDNHTNYHKSSEYRQLKPLLGEGLLTSEDELWRKQRKTMAREFHGGSIDLYLPSIQARTSSYISEIKEGEVDLSEEFSSLTFQIAGEIFFGAKVEEFSQDVNEALEIETERINKRIRSVIKLPLCVPTRENIKGNRALARLDHVVKTIMESEQKEKSHNVLSKLLSTTPSMPKNLIRDEVMTLLLAGHETTSNALTWTIWYLALHPEWQEALTKELHDSGKRACDINRTDTKELKKIRSVIQESMRLMPPIPAISRSAIEEDMIGGYQVPKNISIACQPWVTHRDERFWKEAESWKPERFINREENRDDFSYFPFARGPRSCIGEDLAMVEAVVILAHLVEKFEWKLVKDFKPLPVHNLTLQSKNGMRVVLKEKRKS